MGGHTNIECVMNIQKQSARRKNQKNQMYEIDEMLCYWTYLAWIRLFVSFKNQEKKKEEKIQEAAVAEAAETKTIFFSFEKLWRKTSFGSINFGLAYDEKQTTFALKQHSRFATGQIHGISSQRRHIEYCILYTQVLMHCGYEMKLKCDA